MKKIFVFVQFFVVMAMFAKVNAQVVKGDFNQNGNVDIDDITLLISVYLAGEENTPQTNMENGHEYVDLGLSVKWATLNVGARFYDEYGDYFAWGETFPKSDYSWKTYKWCSNSSYHQLTKYNYNTNGGEVDYKNVLDPEDDAAHVNWGGTWRMPTHAELHELREKCNWEWLSQNGLFGYNVVSKVNGNSIFLPAAGCYYNHSIYEVGERGYYWSNTLCSDASEFAYRLNFESENVYDFYGGLRGEYGFCVRAVCP